MNTAFHPRLRLRPHPRAAAAIVLFISFCAAPSAHADAVFKLPYAGGQSFVVTQGYDSPPTHVKKDAYAIDFTQDGCAAYGRAAVAAAEGSVIFAAEGYNGGYGTEVLIASDGGTLVARYAHLVPGSIAVAKGDAVAQGERVGAIGDTGLVAGAACEAHPGTHLHFAVDRVATGGVYLAYDPEPVSGYTGITEGRWYLSDNFLHEPSSSVIGAVLGASTSSAAASSSFSSSSSSSAVATGTAAAASSSPDSDEEYCPE